ncbi:MAG: MerR family transcriptional regulator [Nitrospirae bacterium]|nr:MerR family transcriptional regulator [Candidatus Troglogloeales bacterium]MBI3598982.1 MerR family transcriptional regulator [Candidatus Troglogloeales bacterium]
MEKLFYKIGEVGKLAELEPYVLRFWESEFPSLSPKKNTGGQRVYSKKEVDLVLEIKRLLYKEGLTISGARKMLQTRKPLRDLPEGTLGEVKKELEELLAILA